MTPNEMIYRRKSCRSFTDKPVDAETLQKIRSFELKPLYPEIKVHMEIVSWDKIRYVCPCDWAAPLVIALYSEEAEGYPENAGFLLQQLDLQLQTLGLGVCWFGIGRMKAEAEPEVTDMRFVIMLVFGYPADNQLRDDLKCFKRKPMEQITDRPDRHLEPARLAPSACNSQPWYFTHQGDTVHVYCSHEGGNLHGGIALAHLYAAYGEAFRFFRASPGADVPGHAYVGSFTIRDN